MTLINQQAQIDNEWTLVNDEQELPAGKILISLERFLENESALAERIAAGEVGVQLRSEQTADQLAEKAQSLAIIAVEFPKFADGRGYSAARLFRERYGYTGELRAVNDVLIDQLFFMARCGFSTYDLREDQDAEYALTVFSTFSQPYQAGVEDTRPLFRRRG